MAYPILTTLAIVFWAGLWAYATLLVVFVILEEADSTHAYPMRMALDRFVDNLSLPWLRGLHRLPLPQRRRLSFALMVLVTLGTVLFFGA
ncbi:MAG: hypothetical protein OHK0012_15220 [Synechococcales cyanobacterium]